MSLRFFYLLNTLFAVMQVAEARVIQVPQHASTVQAGLDSLADGDTLLLSYGIYEELLNAPPFTFFLLGQKLPDSTSNPRPTIDGTMLGGPDTSATLTIPEFAVATIRDIRFRNINRDGIRTRADTLQLFDCVFDSTNHGVYHRGYDPGIYFVVADCRFNANGFSCLRTMIGNCLNARRCAFSGNSTGTGSLVGGGYVTLDSCHFSSESARNLLYVGNSAHITNCIFDTSSTEQGGSTENVSISGRSVLVQDNLFRACFFHYHALSLSLSLPDSASISRNTFEGCESLGGVAHGTVGIFYNTQPDAQSATFSNNTFVRCRGSMVCDDLLPPVHRQISILGNRFSHSAQNSLPSVGGSGSPWQATPFTLRDNVFENCGYALDGSDQTDAILNYWGDASGPYHETDNPLGLGDTITGPVQFIPWLTDTTEGAESERGVLPHEFSVSVIPNPFNSSTRLRFTLPVTSEIRIAVFDLLGRAVKEVADQRFEAGTHQVTIDASNFTSGVYFARVQSNVYSATTKLVLVK